MSYALTLHGRILSLGASASAYASTSTNAELLAAAKAGINAKSTSDAASAAAAAASAASEVELPDCSDAAITGNSYIDSTFVECCQSIKKTWHLSTKEKAKGIAECAARGTATGACLVAGTVTAGVTTALAPLCGEVAGFVANRVMGYSTGQVVAAVTASTVCGALTAGVAGPLCGLAAAELIGWISDTLGPIVEGIFSPSAAKDRELAARRASHALIDATEAAYREADENYRMLWANGIHSLKLLYARAFPTDSLRARARKMLGFSPVYDDLAKALVKHGAIAAPEEWIKPFLDSQLSFKGSGCAVNDYVDPKTNQWDPFSRVCPFSLDAYYNAQLSALIAAGKKSRDDRNAFEKAIIVQIRTLAESIYPLTAQAIAAVASAITMTAIAAKQQELLEAAQAASRAQLASKAASAASRAEAAADAALKGNTEESAAAVLRAKQQYDIAVAASKALLAAMGGTTDAKAAQLCATDASCMKAKNAVLRALKASTQAKENAEIAARNRFLFGGLVLAGAGAAAYMLLRK